MHHAPGSSQEKDPFQKILASYDAPAFMKRGLLVEDSWRFLLARCNQWREENLEWVRIRLGQLHDLAGEWTALRPLLDNENIERLSSLHASLQPKLVVPLAPTSSVRKLRAALDALIDILQRFNAKWKQFVEEIDLEPINKIRRDYNEYYVFEKECALRSAKAARLGFQPLAELTHADLFAEYPLFAIPGLLTSNS